MATTPTEIFEKDIDVVDFDDDKRKRDVESPEVISVVVPELPDATIREAAWTRKCKEWVARVRSLRFIASFLQIESHGIEPIPKERRTDRRYYEFFFVWFSGSFNVLNFSTGSIGPAVFGLNLQEAIITLLIIDFITLLIPSFFGLFGPRHGMRAMVQSRYSLGFYGASLPSLLNAVSLQGFLVINSIIGGQTLASVSKDLSWSIGIVIIGLIALTLSFCGYRVVHWYENVAWIPNVISFSVMLGIGAKHFVNDRSGPPSSIGAIISFASTVAATNISWTPMAADFGVFHSPDVSNWRVFAYTYLGYLSSSIIMHSIGASFAASAPFVPRWNAGYNNGTSVGGLLQSILSPLGVFGNILTVMIALTIPSACTLSMYSCCTSFMTVSPIFAKIPRNVYSIISTAILIPLAIVGSTRFYTTFVNLLSIVGYWSATFTAILVAEHVLFRKMRFEAYDPSQWASPRLLPPGVAGISAFLLPFAVIVPSMSQVWYVGPLAKKVGGDLGLFVGWGSAFVLYIALRKLEKKWVEKRVCILADGPRIERNDIEIVC